MAAYVPRQGEIIRSGNGRKTVARGRIFLPGDYGAQPIDSFDGLIENASRMKKKIILTPFHYPSFPVREG